MINVPEDIKRRIDERYARCPFSSIVVFLRENPDVVKQNIKNKFQDEILDVDL